jgi:hypothetical protein
MKLMLVSLLLGLLAIPTAESRAGIYLEYEIGVSADGSLGGVSFTNKRATFSGVGNTDDVFGFATGYAIPLLSAKVEIQDVGTATFLDAMYLQITPLGTLADLDLVDPSGSRIPVSISQAALLGYDLSTPFSLVGGPFTNYGLGADPTSLGDLRLSRTANGTFMATAVPVPEPSSFMMLAMASWIGMRAVRRKASKSSPF